MHIVRPFALSVPLAFSLSILSCASSAQDSSWKGYGPSPELPKPSRTLIPTVDIAPAKGWQDGQAPAAANGLKVVAFAKGLDHPRWLYVLPNGDVLVAESNAPEDRDDRKGIKGYAMEKVMKAAGAAVPSANRISLLRDADGDGIAETRTAFIEGLHSPFGMALVGNDLYVANTDAIVRVEYREGATKLAGTGERVFELPGGPINHHWTKNIIASRDGKKLYATTGSNSNAAENGIEAEKLRAAILEFDIATGKSRVYASGLRNPNGLAWNETSGALWVTVNERDELGDDLVPDYMTAVKDGGFYGWPYSYFGQHLDDRVKPQRPDLVAKAIVPDYALGSHTASLGLAFFNEGNAMPARYRGGAFVGQHGSWNRSAKSGYKVIYVPFQNGSPAGMPEDILTGFLNEDGEALGRPVGVVFDASGALLVADDVGNTIWRVSASEQPEPPQLQAR
jgi:glucose/arabinose dehydrogenase